LLQPGVPGDAHPRELGDLFAPQSRRSSSTRPAAGRQANVGRLQACPLSTQERGQRSPLGGSISTRIDTSSIAYARPIMPSESAPVVESTIRTGDHVVALINVFSCTPDNQQRLIEAWQRGTDELMRYLPGFISANIHRGLDGTKVINYAQWASRDGFQASFANPRVAAYFDELGQLGTPAPVLAEVVSVHRAASEPS
jgi:quinol monooxygenase YgiN